MNSCLFCTLLISSLCFSQSNVKSLDSIPISKNIKYNYKQIIIPTAFMTYGIIGINNNKLKSINNDLRDGITENIDRKFTVDDYSRYLPALTVYGLNALGIEGKNSLKDRSIILATSFILTTGSVLGLKSLLPVERPDGSNNNSFPSGHTALAFASAEFLYQEYKDVSIWYGISGYIIASGTGYFRIYNDKHWFSDVAMGAGIGILSTKVAYWIFPYINETIFKSKKNVKSAIITPFYNGKQLGIAMLINLK
jgi:hypothetical protein